MNTDSIYAVFMDGNYLIRQIEYFMSECKLCLIRDMAEKADIYEYVKRTRAMLSESEKASDELYEERLNVCLVCDSLLAGTCQKCGCYVEIRAASKSAHCPISRW